MATKQLFFYDDGNFIRVYNEIQNTTTYFNKSNLLAQMSTVDTFYLKNDSNTAFYNFADVSYPAEPTLADLVRTLIKWTQNSSSAWDISKADTMMSIVDPRYANQMYRFDVWSEPEYVPELSANRMIARNAFAYEWIATKKYIHYKKGQDVLAVMNGCLVEPSAGNTNMIGRIGLFEFMDNLGNNVDAPGTAGAYFQLQVNEPNTPGVVEVVLYRRGVADTVVPQTAWNIDKLDGTGPSGLNINWQSLITFVIEMENKVGTKFKMGIMHNNAVVFCHEFIDINGDSLTKDYEPSLPMAWNIVPVSTADLPAYYGTMIQGTAAVFTKQPSSNNQDIHTFNVSMSEPTFVREDTSSIAPHDNNRSLLAIGIRPEYTRNVFTLTKLQIVNTALGIARWELVFDPDIRWTVDPPTFKNVENSVMRYCEDAVYLSSVCVLASGYIHGNSMETIEFKDFGHISAKQDGFPTNVGLRVKVISGTCNLIASIDGGA